MTKNERAAVLGVLQAGHDWCVACKATDYATLIAKWIGATKAHPLTEENDVLHDHIRMGSDHG